MKKEKEKKIMIINGEECEWISSTPGTGFKSKEEEQAFIDNLFNFEEEYDIFNTPNMGVRA